jgi:predicted ATPase/DNA-binding SARP family transcriptional activator
VLGPVELWVDGERVDLGPGKQRGVLAVLLLSAGNPVPLEEVVDRLWGENPPAQTRNTLYSYVARLRRVLRMTVTDDVDLLRRTPGGYVLDIPANLVDCHRFRQFVDQAREPAIRDQERRSLLRQALDQWHGTPLTGVTGDWADRVRHQFEQFRINAATEWADLELTIGDHRQVIDELHDLLSEYPVSEALTGQLMRALHHAGRTAEALDRYAVVRQRIVSEFGAEPSPRLRDIHQEILRATSSVPTPQRLGETRWRGLRPHLTLLVGRDGERGLLATLIERERLVTVTGVGGCGKTALALDVAYEAARRLGTPGVALALAAVTSAEQMVHTLRALLGQTDDGGDPLVAVERILAARPSLLVLDNCEHLAVEVADLVVRLAGSCPGLTVLATSRQPLCVAGEAIFTLEPLSVPDRGRPADPANPAVRLFVERVRQSAPSTAVSEADLEYAAEICRRLDGLPLALELVAARARTFTLADLVDRLGHNMTLLFRTTASGDSRHRTLDATLDWSFQMLTDHQRRLFARMAVFSGGFMVGDAEAVCGFAPLVREEVAATLAALVDRSLVRPYNYSGARRYRLLEVIRNFAARKLADFDETSTTTRQHFDHWLRRARRIDRLPRYHQRVAGLRALEPDAANMRQCLRFGFGAGLAQDAAEIVARTFEFWLVHSGYLAEGGHWLDRALEAPNLGERPVVWALLRFHQALFVKLVDDELRGLRLLRKIIDELARHRPREYLEANAALLHAKQTMLDPSVLDEVEPAVATALRSDEDDDVLTVINAAGIALVTWGYYARALELSHEYDRRGVDLGASSRAAQLTVRIEATLGQGDRHAAQLLVDELVTLLGDVAHAAEQDSPRRVIALNYLVGGQAEQARRFLQDAWIALRSTHPPLTTRLVFLQILLAEAQRRCGQPTTALRTLCPGLTAAAGRAQFRMSFTGVLEAALIAADLGDNVASRQLATRWDMLRRRLRLPLPVGFAEVATHTLGLSPALSVGRSARWNPDALHASVASAAEWCAKQLPATPQPRRTMR